MSHNPSVGEEGCCRPPPAWAPAVLVAVALAAMFHLSGNSTLGYIPSRSLFVWWGFQWFNPRSETQHGPLIVLMAAWLWWRNRRVMPVRPGDAGGAGAAPWMALAGALLLHAAGHTMQQARLSIAGLLLGLWAVLALAGGRRGGRAALFPVAFLVFAVPAGFLDTAGFHLRLWVVKAACALAQSAGSDVVRSGTQVFSPDGGYQYEVAAACSGVRSLVALLALSCVIGYLGFRTWAPRCLVVLLCIPFTVAGNIIRLLAIIAAAGIWGQEAGRVVHEWFGFLVFVIVLGMQLATVRLLERVFPGARAEVPCTVPVACRRPPRMAEMAGAASAALAALAFVPGLRWIDALQPPVRTGVRLAANGVDPAPLPSLLGSDWYGRDVEVSAIEREVLPAGTGFSRRLYTSLLDPRHHVFVSIVLSGTDRSSIHGPELCLVGQGWIPGPAGETVFNTGAGLSPLPATILPVRRSLPDGGSFPSLIAYWFVGGDRVVAGYGERMVRGALDRLLRLRRDRWAYVLLQTDASDGDEAACARLAAVVALVAPEILRVKPCGE